MKVHNYFISHRGSDEAIDLFHRLSQLRPSSELPKPVWLDLFSWTAVAPLREDIGFALINSEWCVACCSDDLLSSEWCLLECTAAAEANRLLLYRPELLETLPAEWEGAGSLTADLSFTAPAVQPSRRPRPFMDRASLSAQIYLEHRSMSLLEQRLRMGKQGLWSMAVFELALRNLKPVIKKHRHDLSSSDCTLLMEICRITWRFWSQRERALYEQDFTSYMAPVLLLLIGTVYEEEAIETYESIAEEMSEDLAIYRRAIDRVLQKVDVADAIWQLENDLMDKSTPRGDLHRSS